MSKRVKLIPPNDFGGLFSDCATHCDLFSVCSGHATAPCGCAWTLASGKRHKCDECHLICRDRKTIEIQDNTDSISYNPISGKFINDVSISQNSNLAFPLFIPINTHLFKGDPLPIDWAAVDMNTLFTKPTKKMAKLSSNFKTAAKVEEFLNVNSSCNVLAILNGQDKYLENLWGMGEINRRNFFEQLMTTGISIATGATYSVSSQTSQTDRKTYTSQNISTLKNVPTPQYHNISMLLRHHKVLDELQTTGFYSIPNLYWKDNDKKELNFWKKWLTDNPEIHTISRDFTSTKTPKEIKPKIEELVTLLKSVGRKFHIMIIGTGSITAPMVLKKLLENGFTASFITPTPIYEARIAAVRYTIIHNEIVKEIDYQSTHSELILNNMQVFKKRLSLVMNSFYSKQNSSNIMTNTPKFETILEF